MTQRIIYQNDEGGVSVIVPSDEAVAKYGIAAIAQKDVPYQKEYWIVDAADIPSDRTFRNAFVLDVAALGAAHGVGGASSTF